MRKQLRLRPLGWMVALSTLAAMSATMALAATGSAASPEKEYTSSVNAVCVVSPGVLNIHSEVTIALRGTAPAELEPGQEFSLKNSSSTITTPVELTEAFASLGATEVKGKVTRLILEAIGAEPAGKNIAQPGEYPEGLPFFAAVNAGQSEVFNIPSKALGETGLTYTAATWKVTAGPGGAVQIKLTNEKGFTETEPGVYKATGEGIVSEVEGRKEGAHVIGPLTVACNATGSRLALIPVAGTPPTTTTTTTAFTTTTILDHDDHHDDEPSDHDQHDDLRGSREGQVRTLEAQGLRDGQEAQRSDHAAVGLHVQRRSRSAGQVRRQHGVPRVQGVAEGLQRHALHARAHAHPVRTGEGHDQARQ